MWRSHFDTYPIRVVRIVLLKEPSDVCARNNRLLSRPCGPNEPENKYDVRIEPLLDFITYFGLGSGWWIPRVLHFVGDFQPVSKTILHTGVTH